MGILEVIVSNYTRIVLMFVNTFFTCRVMGVWNSLDNVIVYRKLFKDFNEKLKNNKHLECFLKGRALI